MPPRPDIDPSLPLACQRCLTHLHAFVDGELDTRAAAAVATVVRDHVATCQYCKAVERHLRALQRMLAGHADRAEPASDALRARIDETFDDLLAG